MSIKNIIDLENEGINPNVVNLLKLGWLSSIEELSNYRKAGNGLKRKLKNPIVLNKEDVYYKLDHIYSNMYTDLETKKGTRNIQLINHTCIDMDKFIEDSSVTGVIFLHLMLIASTILKFIS